MNNRLTTKSLQASVLAQCLVALLLLSVNTQAKAAENHFEGGWLLDSDSSSLTFQSIKEKNGPKQETSSFASLSGSVDEAGQALVTVQLESVDTKIDLRNVRMRFLFFETFKFPEATVTSLVSAETMALLYEKRRITLPIEFDLNLHGVTQSLEVNIILTLFADDQLSIATVEPVKILASVFGLEEGIKKLQDAAKVTIVPSGAVSFDLVFKKATSARPMATAEPAQSVASVPAVTDGSSFALESTGELSDEECFGRFDILSDTGAVYFRSGSSRLDPNSEALLSTVIDIIERCPALDIVVAGHTDSAGGEQINLTLSIARADSVLRYLINNGIQGSRITAIGFGETQPVAPNDTARNRGRNRRIEFTATSG